MPTRTGRTSSPRSFAPMVLRQLIWGSILLIPLPPARLLEAARSAVRAADHSRQQRPPTASSSDFPSIERLADRDAHCAVNIRGTFMLSAEFARMLEVEQAAVGRVRPLLALVGHPGRLCRDCWAGWDHQAVRGGPDHQPHVRSRQGADAGQSRLCRYERRCLHLHRMSGCRAGWAVSHYGECG